MPKNVNGDPSGFINLHSVAKYQKNSKAGPFGDIKKIFEKKVAQCRKNPKGDPLGTSGFVGFLEKVKNEGGPFGLSLPWRDLALGGFRIVSKNKPGTAQVGAISKAQKDSKTTFSTTGDNKSSQKN